ncbi:MAG: hypothetical protein ACC682_14570 [Gemmatimonadota bacterium]
MDILLFSAIFVVGAAFVLYPVLPRNRAAVPRAFGVEGDETLGLLVAEKDVIYADIKDLDFEFETGKLSTTDYAELREALRVRALHVLERIGESETGPEGVSRAQFCGSCGAGFEADDQFCRTCGEARTEILPAAVSHRAFT